MRKENKNKDFFACDAADVEPGSTVPCLQAEEGTHMHRGTLVNGTETDIEENKSLNKVSIFVFFAHKKYSHSFIKLQMNH